MFHSQGTDDYKIHQEKIWLPQTSIYLHHKNNEMKFSWRSPPAMREMKSILTYKHCKNLHNKYIILKFSVLQTFWHQITFALPTRITLLRSLPAWLLAADKERKKLVLPKSLIQILCMLWFLHNIFNTDTYHCVHTLKSIPVRALQQRIAVLIRTDGSFSGSGPSSEGDQCPPIAMASSLPFIPTKNYIRKSMLNISTLRESKKNCLNGLNYTHLTSVYKPSWGILSPICRLKSCSRKSSAFIFPQSVSVME